MMSVFHIEAKWYLQVYTQIHGDARSAVARKDTERRGDVSLTEWNSQVLCNNCVINIPINYSAVSCECFHTPGCKCLPLISCHQGKLSTQRHITVSSHIATRSANHIPWVHCVLWRRSLTHLFCRSCSPFLSCVLSTWARRGHRTGLQGQGLCTSLCCNKRPLL